MRKYMALVACVVAVLMTAVGASASEEGWTVEVTPSVWLVGLEGDMTVNGQEVEFDKSFSDLVDSVEFGGSLRVGAEYKRFVIGALADYFSLSTDEMDVEDQPQGGSLDSDILLTEAAMGYRVDGWAEGQSFVFMAGLRNLHMENELEVYGKGTRSKDNDVTDPMFYVLPSIPLFPSKIEGLRFNPVLGIGAGGDADLVYELFPQIQYQLSDILAVRFGYRTVGYKFEGDDNEDNELNIRMAGLVAGFGWVF